MVVARKIPELCEHQLGFCGGCGHGIALRLTAEVIEENGLLDNFILASGVTCGILALGWGRDQLICAHGRAPAVAAGLKVAQPNALVLTYQGDGDAYVIGLAETLNSAYRNENITVIAVNNGVFGMTGGQMSWTTLPGQRTTTSPLGRDAVSTGQPLRVPEIIAQHFEPAFVARGSTHNVTEIRRTKRYLQSAVEAQMAGEGFCLVEILAACPTGLGMSTKQACDRIASEVVREYPVGVLCDRRQAVSPC